MKHLIALIIILILPVGLFSQEITNTENEDDTYISDSGSFSDFEGDIAATQGLLKDQVLVVWKEIANADYYRVYRANNINGIFIEKSGKITDPKWIDTNVETGRYYWYKVRPFKKFIIGKASKKAQGWAMPEQISETANEGGKTGMISWIIKMLPNWLNKSNIAKKYEKNMPQPMIIKDEYILTDEEIYNHVENVCSNEHRRVGTEEAHAAENYIINELNKIIDEHKENCTGSEVKNDIVDFNIFKVDNYGLQINEYGLMFDYECFYASNTGIDEEKPNGGTVSGEMVWAGEGTDEDFQNLIDEYGDTLTEKIVVLDTPVAKIPLGMMKSLLKDTYYVSDPYNDICLLEELKVTAMMENFPHEFEGKPNNPNSVYWRACDAGVQGIVAVLKNYCGNVNAHWGPYGTRFFKGMPVVYVDNYSRDEIMGMAEDHKEASITIEGSIDYDGWGRNIYVQLKGKSDETIFVTTHHDAAFKGATEDGTGIAMVLTMFKAWAQVPFEQREKTLLFHFSAGHFYGGKGAEVFADKHKNDILKDVIVNINLEHIAAKKIKEEPETRDLILDNFPDGTNRGALELLWVTGDPLAISVSRRMLQTSNPKRHVCVPGNIFGPIPPGESGHYHLILGIPYIQYLGFPQYLICNEDTLNKVDKDMLHSSAVDISELIGSYMMIPDGHDPWEQFQ